MIIDLKLRFYVFTIWILTLTCLRNFSEVNTFQNRAKNVFTKWFTNSKKVKWLNFNGGKTASASWWSKRTFLERKEAPACLKTSQNNKGYTSLLDWLRLDYVNWYSDFPVMKNEICIVEVKTSFYCLQNLAYQLTFPNSEDAKLLLLLCAIIVVFLELASTSVLETATEKERKVHACINPMNWIAFQMT